MATLDESAAILTKFVKIRISFNIIIFRTIYVKYYLTIESYLLKGIYHTQ